MAAPVSASQRPRARRSPLRLALIAAWALVAGWLVVSIAVSITRALATGQGPVRTEAAEDPGDAAPPRDAPAPAPTGR